MTCRSGPVRALLAWAVVCIAGCSTTRVESPRQSAVEQSEAPSEAAPPLVLQVTVDPAKRYRPTDKSIEQIRRENAEAPPPEGFSDRLDHAHDATFAWTQGRVQALDNSLARKNKTLEPVPAAPFRVSLVGGWFDRNPGSTFEFNGDVDMEVSLPNVEDRLGIFVTSGGLDEAPEDPGRDTRLSAGLRYEILHYLKFDLGVRADLPPVAFASLKWSREIPLGGWDFYPFVKLFAETKQSVGYAAAATFDRWSGRQLLRTSTYAKWRVDRDRTQWSETLIYARANQLIVPNRYGSYLRADDIGRGWGVRLLAAGRTAHSVDRYESGIFYRMPTRNRWLFWSVEPLVRWDRDYDWSADPGIRIGIEALFWDLVR